MEISIRQQVPDQYQSEQLGQALINVVTTETGVRLRPGLLEMYDLGESSPVVGIHDWYSQNLTIVVCNNKIFKLNDDVNQSGLSYLLLEGGDKLIIEDGTGSLLLDTIPSVSDVTSSTVGGNSRAIFADAGDYLYIATGGKILELHPSASQVSYDDGGGSRDYTCLTNNINSAPATGGTTDWQDDGLNASSTYDLWDSTIRYGSGYADELEDTSWPTTVSWVAIVDTYLFAISDSTQNIYQSVVEQPWNNAGAIFQAEQLPDNATCMRVYGGDLVVGGLRSIQSFVNDGSSSVFIPSNYGAITTGVLAPYSFVEVGGNFIFIDNERRVVALQGREPRPLSNSLNSFLRTIPTLTDAIADEVVFDGITYYVCRFPSTGTTVAVNVVDGSWSEWTYDDSGINRSWAANCISYIPRWDYIIAGDRSDGTLKKVASRYSDDDGTAIDGVIRSVRVQTGARVRVSDLIVALTKVTASDGAGSASFTVRWRDDGGGWSTARTYTIQDNETTDVVAHIRRLGSYRHNRQYEFDVSNLHPYAIQRVEQV